MNYIKHLTGFFEKVSPDFDLNPTHISLYMALFQLWNQNRFKNPIAVHRDELMRISKIASYATFHKCIRELHEKQFVDYRPSHNSFRGSLLDVIPLDGIDSFPLKKRIQKLQTPFPFSACVTGEHKPNIEQVDEQAAIGVLNIPCTSAVFSPYINNTNSINNENGLSLADENSPYLLALLEEQLPQKKLRDKKGVAGSAKIPPQREGVLSFFVAQGSLEVEAQKFYNYFESNGWLVGGKAKMKDWKAAARNWMLHVADYSPSTNRPQAGHLHTSIQKNYDEPL